MGETASFKYVSRKRRVREDRRFVSGQATYVSDVTPPGTRHAAVLTSAGGETLTWAVFPGDTDYFGSGDQQAMVNYRVRDLDAMLAQLRAAGVPVDDSIHESEFGRFGWATDPEGNRFELWQPPSA